MRGRSVLRAADACIAGCKRGSAATAPCGRWSSNARARPWRAGDARILPGARAVGVRSGDPLASSAIGHRGGARPQLLARLTACAACPPLVRFSTVGIERAGIALAVIAFMVAATPAAAATRTHTFRVGPVNIGGYASEKGFDIAPTPRRSGYVTAMYARLVNSQGRPVPQERVMLHHAFFLNYGRFRGDRRGGDCHARPAQSLHHGGGERRSCSPPATATRCVSATAGAWGGCT